MVNTQVPRVSSLPPIARVKCEFSPDVEVQLTLDAGDELVTLKVKGPSVPHLDPVHISMAALLQELGRIIAWSAESSPQLEQRALLNRMLALLKDSTRSSVGDEAVTACSEDARFVVRQAAAKLRPTLGPMPTAEVTIDRTQILEMAKDWSARMIQQFRDHEDLKPNPRNIEAVFRHFEDLVTKPAPVAADADGGQ